MIASCTGSDVYLEGSLCAQDQNILANAFPRRTGEGHEDVVVSSYEELGIRGLRRLPERQSNRLGQGQHHLDPLRNENLLMKSAHLRQTDCERQQPRRDTFWSQASGGVRAELGSLTHQREKCELPFFKSWHPRAKLRYLSASEAIAISNHNPHAAPRVDKVRGSFFRRVGTCDSSRKENINRDEANSTKKLWRDGELHERKHASFSRDRTSR